MLELERGEWPMTRENAILQRNYLKKLWKYRVLAVPAGYGAISQSGAVPQL